MRTKTSGVGDIALFALRAPRIWATTEGISGVIEAAKRLEGLTIVARPRISDWCYDWSSMSICIDGKEIIGVESLEYSE